MLWFATRVAAAGGAGAACAMAAMQHAYAVPEENRKPLRGARTAVVMGGGVVGIATARELARSGLHVRVLEARSGAGQGTTSAAAGHIAISAYHTSLATVSMFLNVMGSLLRDSQRDHVDEPDDLQNVKFVKWSTWLDWNYLAWSASWLHIATRHVSAPVLSAFGTGAMVDAVDPLMQTVKQARVLDQKRALFTAAAEEELVELADMRDTGRTSVAMHTFHKSGFGMRKPGSLFTRLSAGELARDEPCFAAAHDDGLVRGAQFAQGDAFGDPRKYTQALAQKLVDEQGVRIDYNTEIRRLETEGGRMKGVRLKTGELVEADVYVIAAGADTPDIAFTAGVHVPITQMRGYKLVAPAKEGEDSKVPRNALCIKPYELYVTPLKHHVHFASFGEFAPRWDCEPTPELEERLEYLINLVFPDVSLMVEWDERRSVWGRRPQTPDGNPVVSPTRVAGLYINSGHCSYGWRGATHSAQLLARGIREGFEANGIYWRLTSLARFQLLRPRWGACVDPRNMPSCDDLKLSQEAAAEGIARARETAASMPRQLRSAEGAPLRGGG